jgi:hypothetical protein
MALYERVWKSFRFTTHTLRALADIERKIVPEAHSAELWASNMGWEGMAFCLIDRVVNGFELQPTNMYQLGIRNSSVCSELWDQAILDHATFVRHSLIRMFYSLPLCLQALPEPALLSLIHQTARFMPPRCTTRTFAGDRILACAFALLLSYFKEEKVVETLRKSVLFAGMSPHKKQMAEIREFIRNTQALVAKYQIIPVEEELEYIINPKLKALVSKCLSVAV